MLCRFLLLLFAGALLAGCKKDRTHTSAEGVVIDATTQTRVAGARVYLLQTKGTSLYASASRVQHVEADNLGKFSLSFEAEDDSQYDLQATAPTFFDTPSNEYVGIVKGDKNKKNVTVRPEAWLRIRFVSQTSGKHIVLTSPSDYPYPRFSSPIDTSIVIRCNGNEDIQMYTGQYSSGTTPTSVQYSVRCPAHDTTDFTIRF